MQHLSPIRTSQFLRQPERAVHRLPQRNGVPFRRPSGPAIHLLARRTRLGRINPHFVGEIRKLASQSDGKPAGGVDLPQRRNPLPEEAARALRATGFGRVNVLSTASRANSTKKHQRNSITAGATTVFRGAVLE